MSPWSRVPILGQCPLTYCWQQKELMWTYGPVWYFSLTRIRSWGYIWKLVSWLERFLSNTLKGEVFLFLLSSICVFTLWLSHTAYSNLFTEAWVLFVKPLLYKEISGFSKKYAWYLKYSSVFSCAVGQLGNLFLFAYNASHQMRGLYSSRSIPSCLHMLWELYKWWLLRKDEIISNSHKMSTLELIFKCFFPKNKGFLFWDTELCGLSWPGQCLHMYTTCILRPWWNSCGI